MSFPAPTPAQSINATKSMHWGARRRALEPWGEAVTWAWKALPLAERALVQDVPCDVQITIPFATSARRDPHNYVGTICKVVVDGLKSHYASPGKGRPNVLVWRGVWPDDGPEWVRVLEPLCVKGGDVIVELIPREAK